MNIDPSPDTTQSPTRLPLQGISLEAALTVREIETSLNWYRDVLGFDVDRMYERDGFLMAVSIRAGAVRLLLGQDDGRKGDDRVRGEGFSLQITVDGDVDEIARGIKERGGVLAIDPVDSPAGRRVFRLVDPDGFKLTISSR